MAKESLDVLVSVGDEQLSVRELVKMLKTSRKTEVSGTKLKITTRTNKVVEINIKSLSLDQAEALFSNGFEKVDDLFKTYVNGLESADVSRLYNNLTAAPASASRVSSYINPKTVAAYLASFSANQTSHKGSLNKLTPQQAGLVLNESFNEQVEAAKNNEVAATDPLKLWKGLSESSKYNPETFKEIILDAGTPLFANSRKYRKLVDKNKLVAAMSTASVNEINNIINTFGSRSIFSDEYTVGKIIEAVTAQGIKTGKTEEAIEKTRALLKLSGEYKEEAAKIGDFNVSRNQVDSAGKLVISYSDLLDPKFKHVSLGKNALSEVEKNKVKEKILTLDLSTVKTKEDLTKVLQKTLGKTSVSRLFSDSMLVKELLTDTLSARALKDFYYGKFDKKSKTTQMLPVKDIMKNLGGLGDLMYSLMKDNRKVLDPLKSLDAASAMAKLTKKHPGIETHFSENSKLSQKAKNKFLKQVAKGKFDGKKGAEKFNKFIDKNLVKITSDKDFVNEVLSTLEDKAYGEVLNDSLDSKKKKGKKSQSQIVLDNNKVLFDSLVQTYDVQLTKSAELVTITADTMKELTGSQVYQEQLKRRQSQGQVQEEEKVLEPK